MDVSIRIFYGSKIKNYDEWQEKYNQSEDGGDIDYDFEDLYAEKMGVKIPSCGPSPTDDEYELHKDEFGVYFDEKYKCWKNSKCEIETTGSYECEDNHFLVIEQSKDVEYWNDTINIIDHIRDVTLNKNMSEKRMSEILKDVAKVLDIEIEEPCWQSGCYYSC